MKKSFDFSVKRPQKKSIVTLILSALVLSVLWISFYFFFNPTPQTLIEKILQAVLFCVAVIGTFFAGGFFINSIICLVASPSIKIKNDTLSVIGNYDMKLDDIGNIEEVKDKKNNIKKLLVRSKNSSGLITIKEHISDLPLSELKEKLNSIISDRNLS